MNKYLAIIQYMDYSANKRRATDEVVAPDTQTAIMKLEEKHSKMRRLGVFVSDIKK